MISSKTPVAKGETLRTECSILHTSDIHLDNRIGYDGDESAGQLGLIGVIDAAIKLDVDLFLLAGDLFDHNRVKDPCLEFATQQLSRLQCPVVMIAGNHDCMTDYSIYNSYDPSKSSNQFHFITNVAGDVVELPKLGIKLWGRGIVDHAPENKPLENVPQADYEGWYIGMAHGYYTERGGTSFSSLITPEEIADSRLDYLALGHVHVFSEMRHGNTIAAYSGSPNKSQGASECTVAHIQLHPENGIKINRILL